MEKWREGAPQENGRSLSQNGCHSYLQGLARFSWRPSTRLLLHWPGVSKPSLVVGSADSATAVALCYHLHTCVPTTSCVVKLSSLDGLFLYCARQVPLVFVRFTFPCRVSDARWVVQGLLFDQIPRTVCS